MKLLLREALTRGNNNFEAYRLVAALMVIWGHAYALVPDAQGQDFIGRLTGFTYSGSVAVKLFFFLSGLLIANSLMRGTQISRFISNRIARIWPGLVVSSAVVIWLIGPLVSTLDSSSYFASRTTGQVFLHNLVVGPLTNTIGQNLPGVFAELPYTAAQGTLWTIPYELMCYAVLGLGFVIFREYRRWISLAITTLLLVGALYPNLNILPSGEIALAIFAFSLGVTASLFQDQIRVNLQITISLIVFALVLRGSEFREVAFYLAFIAVALWISTRREMVKIKLPGDYSYGIYLYGWPLQQALSEMNISDSTLVNQLATMTLAVVAGALSWHLVEKPALLLVRRLDVVQGKSKFLTKLRRRAT